MLLNECLPFMKVRVFYGIIVLSALFISCEKEKILDTRIFVTREELAAHLDENAEFVIILPDIQNYINDKINSLYLEKILNFILTLDSYEYSIKAVLQVGDVTNFNSLNEWSLARDLFSKLDNKIPYIMCTGNHDYGINGDCTTRDTYFSKFFNYKIDTLLVARFEENNNENTVFEIEIFDQPIQIFSLEFGPRDKVIAWADSIAKANTDVIGMLLTHAYLYKNGQRYNFSMYKFTQTISPYSFTFSKFEKVNDGEEIWQKLVYPNDIFRFVFCGHKTEPDYIGSMISENINNHQCLQLLFNTQELPNGGNGWIQILEFHRDKISVSIKNHSVVLKLWCSDILQQSNFIYN